MNGAGAAVAVRTTLDQVGRAAYLGWSVARVLPRPRLYLGAAIQQGYALGVKSLPLVLIMAALGGAVTSQQTGAQFAGGLPLWVVGSVVAAAVLTELGPVMTGLVLIGRVGASIAAELASMKVSEQVDALYAMGRDPVAYLVVPRVVAGTLVAAPLVIMANAAGIVTGWLVALMTMEGLTTADFVYGMRYYFRPFVLFFSLLKGVTFGLAITFLACLIGLGGRGGAAGVGRTTTAAVVATTLALMILDLLLTPLLKAF